MSRVTVVVGRELYGDKALIARCRWQGKAAACVGRGCEQRYKSVAGEEIISLKWFFFMVDLFIALLFSK